MQDRAPIEEERVGREAEVEMERIKVGRLEKEPAMATALKQPKHNYEVEVIGRTTGKKESKELGKKIVGPKLPWFDN